MLARRQASATAVWQVVPILIAFVAVAVAFSVVVPVLEAPDEPSHLAMVRYLLVNHTLPDQRPELGFPAGQEGSQPPLYYALGAVLFSLSPGPAIAPTFADNNPYVSFSRARDPRVNRNLYAHLPSEAWPFRGDVLGIHLLRLLSVLFGAVTVLSTYLIARELFPERPLVMVLAPALVALNPQFVFIASVVNNDSAIAATATLVIWLLTRWLIRGGSTRLAVAVGLGLGLALLAKTDGLLLVPLAGLVLLVDLCLRRQLGRRLPRVALVGGLALATAGWWFARNQLLYGDPLGWSAMLAANAQMVRDSPIDNLSALRLLWQARGTYWAAFGWTNLLASDRANGLLDAAQALALVGVVAGLWRARVKGAAATWWLALLLLILWPALVVGSLVRWVAINSAADQGRLLFPAVGCFAVLLAFGCAELARVLPVPTGVRSAFASSRARSWLASAFAVAAAVAGLGVNGWVLFGDIAPVYRPVPPTLAATTAPRLRFGSELELVDEKIAPRVGVGGGTVDVDLTWRATRPIQKNWSISLALLGDDATPLAKVESWPQAGRAPTTAWQVGQLYHDHYTLTLDGTGPDPQLAPLWLSVFDSTVAGGPGLLVRDSRGQAIGAGAAIGQVKLPGLQSARLRPRDTVSVTYGRAIELVGYDASIDAGSLHLTLYWHDDQPVISSYTVFVHLVDRSGHVLAQQDSLPRSGNYPTSAWSPGETIRDEHAIHLAGLVPDTYEVVVGLYQATTGTRLPIASSTADASIVDNGAGLFVLPFPR